MVDKAFNNCVDALNWVSKHTGMTYQQVNVYLFCVAWPIVTITLAGALVIVSISK